MTGMMRKSSNTLSAKQKREHRGSVIGLQEYPTSVRNVLIVDRGITCRHQIDRIIQFHGIALQILSDKIVS